MLKDNMANNSKETIIASRVVKLNEWWSTE